jgi:transcriptional regulator
MIYVPHRFAEPEEERLFELIVRNPFATLVSFHSSEPWISHLPFLIDRKSRRLRGHMARANLHWKALARGESIVIFHGPHHYISPSWYGHHPSVPTWNYATVHVRGEPQLIEETAALEKLLFEQVRGSEPRDGGWQPDLPRDYLDGMVKAIVGFEIPIAAITGKYKLSQNRPADDQVRVTAALRAVGSDQAREVADLMQARLETGVR